MKAWLVLALVILLGCKENKPDLTEDQSVTNSPEIAEAITLDIYDFEGIEPFLNRNDDKTYVVNFWATWCAPCVKELPYFEQLGDKYRDRNVEVLLVSLDFPNQYEKKLKPFIVKHQLKSKILVLDDVDMNSWIPKVDPDWDGAIPVTLIYNRDSRKFYAQSFDYDTLENEILSFIN